MVLAVSVDIRRSARVAAVVLAAIAGSSLITACQNDPDIDITKLTAETDPPDVLYNQGLANLNAGKTTEAARKFEAIDKQHPFSEYARKALVMNAFVSYRNGQYQDAINSTNRYLNLYPQSEDAAYAQYIQGLAYTKQIPSVTQDQRPAAKAIEAMQVVVDKYPDSEYVDDAQAKIRFARDQLAGKEMQVGRYYLERKEYLAAISRFRTVVERYPTTNQVEEALARLVEAYYAMGVTGEAQTAAAVLGHNYPDSQWYADSYKLLQSGGLEPRETGTSWIARAGKNLIGA
ncbi:MULTISPECIES: outer membrane protein assembly factor BamD [Sinorhizobium]|jgi:outer membrane protein assembly factor BamD|uniref:Outer membrane protein assembly factor BamD n=1 Tax=Rhizobium meliloti TaxID=382 RepID=A0A2J0Z3Q3_RHIML|nr:MULTISPECIES: outer membrane protein assembly factor BamD [Sinorhizobium]PND23586.1 outer membrane protein assembly factor BamD [Ensifer sp. MMN_5]GCA51202.1 outer membrane protein assembly factor BamD precursor [Sinorhizobium sp. KGO-5]MCG5483863.1 outer membrane protein assembly factor BamD [Sinorhizobium meliloti]PJR15176.1 outer membrane protein assembly factor BamD [Sinorhizobium meliloti]PND28899.1 outer membrane protein assembly factor BamD [Sinorhizobium sp. M4_45]